MRPLIHGAAYFAELRRRVSQTREGDLLLFADWRGDPDERLTGSAGTEVGTGFAEAARNGVDVRGLLWRSHWDRMAFSAEENRQLGDEINDAGGQCLLDMRARTGGSHYGRTHRLSAAARSAGLRTVPGTRTPIATLHEVAPGRVAIYGLESPQGLRRQRRPATTLARQRLPRGKTPRAPATSP